MRTLISDILTYSKSTDLDANLSGTDLNLLFDGVVTELDLKISEKNALITNLGLPELKVIKFQFHQLFLNLLSNAL